MKKTRSLPVQKNQTLKVTIEDLTHDGFGVAKIAGYPIFIENTLPTEKAEILVIKVGKKFGYGKLQKLLEKSPDRVETTEQNLIRTGIAPLHHLNYSAQLVFKQKQVKKVMTKIAHQPDVKILSTLGMEKPWAYRNKAQIPVRQIDGQLTTGFFRRNSHDLISLENFFIQDPKIDEAIVKVRDILQKYHVQAYNEAEHTGNLRHIIVRRAHYTGEMMIVLVTRKAKIFPEQEIAADIKEAVPEVVSIMQNIQPLKTNVILGTEMKVLYGKETIEDHLLGKTYQIAASAFYQVNTRQAEVLYQTAIDFAELKPTDIVWDVYCGIGTIGLSLADHVKEVYGVEIVSAAVENARKNAQLNQIENAWFEAGKAEEVLPKWEAAGRKADVIIVDPPRKGLAASLIETLTQVSSRKIVYISCNPATFARDCELLVKAGYQVEKIQPVDMFPQTAHVELVGLLIKK